MGDINGLTCAKRISKHFELLDFHTNNLFEDSYMD